MSVSGVCCVLSGRSLCEGPITRTRNPSECGVSGSDRGTSQTRPRPTGVGEPRGKKNSYGDFRQFIASLFFIDTSYLLITYLLNVCYLH